MATEQIIILGKNQEDIELDKNSINNTYLFGKLQTLNEANKSLLDGIILDIMYKIYPNNGLQKIDYLLKDNKLDIIPLEWIVYLLFKIFEIEITKITYPFNLLNYLPELYLKLLEKICEISNDIEDIEDKHKIQRLIYKISLIIFCYGFEKYALRLYLIDRFKYIHDINKLIIKLEGLLGINLTNSEIRAEGFLQQSRQDQFIDTFPSWGRNDGTLYIKLNFKCYQNDNITIACNPFSKMMDYNSLEMLKTIIEDDVDNLIINLGIDKNIHKLKLTCKEYNNMVENQENPLGIVASNMMDYIDKNVRNKARINIPLDFTGLIIKTENYIPFYYLNDKELNTAFILALFLNKSKIVDYLIDLKYNYSDYYDGFYNIYTSLFIRYIRNRPSILTTIYTTKTYPIFQKIIKIITLDKNENSIISTNSFINDIKYLLFKLIKGKKKKRFKRDRIFNYSICK